MKTTFLTSVRYSIIVMFLSLFASQTMFASVPDAPKKFSAEAYAQYGAIVLSWQAGDDVDYFDLYRAEGKTDDKSKFAKVDLDSVSRERSLYYIVQTEQAGTYSYYVIAVNSDGDSKPSSIATVTLKKGHDRVWFTNHTNESMVGSIGVGDTFTFDWDAESNVDNTTIIYSVKAENDSNIQYSINHGTGEFECTATEKGYYYFTVTASLDGYPETNVSSGFYVFVKACSVGSTITGTVVDEETGAKIKGGYVYLMTKDGEMSGDIGDGYYGEVIDGEYTLENVDAGDYYLLFYGYASAKNSFYQEEYYNNVTDVEDAQVLTIECASNYTYDADLELVEMLYGNITITNGPEDDAIAKINVEYTFDFDYEIDNAELQDVPVDFYINGHNNSNLYGATIDETTGKFSWTPTAAGIYKFHVFATIDDSLQQKYHYLAGDSKWFTIVVTECDYLPTIKGDVTDTDGAPIKFGIVSIYRTNSNYSYLTANIIDGKYEITPDKGDYVLYFDECFISSGNDSTGYKVEQMYYPQWFDGVDKRKDATVISLDCGDVYVADAVLEEYDHKYEYVRIISEPVKTVKVNTTYTYDVGIETNVDDADFLYSLKGPEGATINSETGLITWAPTENGRYSFAVKVSSGDSSSSSHKYFVDMQYFDVMVLTCDNPGSITVNVVDEDNNPLAMGIIIVYKKGDNAQNPNDSLKYYSYQYYSELPATIEGLDQGEYYVSVTPYGRMCQDKYYTYWYDGATNFYNATPIEINCGDAMSFTAVIKAIPEPTYYSVKGNVLDAETKEALKHSYVVFEGTDDVYGNSISKWVQTDNDGQYEVMLPDTYKYIVSAYASNEYLMEYYDNTTDVASAKVITLTGDLSNINFELEKAQTYENTLYGTLTTTDGGDIVAGVVVAYLVEAANEAEKGFLYTSYSTRIDSAGSFVIANLIPGKYVLYGATKESTYISGYYLENNEAITNWESASKVVVNEIGNSGSYTITLPLRKGGLYGGGRIVGKVHGKGHKIKLNGDLSSSDPLMGANIYLIDSEGGIVLLKNTDEFGQFTLEGLTTGTYVLVADKVGYSTSLSEVVIDNNTDSEDVTVELTEEVTAVNDETANTSVTVFPNPADASIKLTVNAIAGNATVAIYDLTGELVYSSDYNTTNGENVFLLNVDYLTTGTYYVRVINGDTVNTHRFIKK